MASTHQVPLFSSSALRFAESLSQGLTALGEGVVGADFYGPTAWQPPIPGWFWYGIHPVDMLYRALGTGCYRVEAVSTPGADMLVGTWADGRVGSIRGNRMGNNRFGGLLHGTRGVEALDVSHDVRPYYASLLEAIVTMFQTRTPPVDAQETREVIRFIEAANESAVAGRPVLL
jgi:hypothetical protein